MNDITLIGNIGQPPKLVYSDRTGTAVLRFSLAINKRYQDRDTGEWRDAKTVWTDVVAFGPIAENAANSLSSGDPVIVYGELADNSFTPTDADGAPQREVRRTELVAKTIGPDLRYATAEITRQARRERNGSATAPAAG